MFKKILVCLDGSEIAEKIIPIVKEEASATSSEIILIRVVGISAPLSVNIPGFPGVPVRSGSMPEQIEKEEILAKEYVRQVAQSLREEGLQVISKTLVGSPGPTIVNFANENKIDLIAIASHGHSGLRNVLLGSVAEYVIRESGLPILMIRPK